MEAQEKLAAIRYEALSAHCHELHREVEVLLGREEQLTETLVDAILECEDTDRLVAELEATWAALTPRQAALSRVDEMLRRQLRMSDQAT